MYNADVGMTITALAVTGAGTWSTYEHFGSYYGHVALAMSMLCFIAGCSFWLFRKKYAKESFD